MRYHSRFSLLFVVDDGVTVGSYPGHQRAKARAMARQRARRHHSLVELVQEDYEVWSSSNPLGMRQKKRVGLTTIAIWDGRHHGDHRRDDHRSLRQA